LVELDMALGNFDWLDCTYKRLCEFAAAWRPLHQVELHVEQDEFGAAFMLLGEQYAVDHGLAAFAASGGMGTPTFPDVCEIDKRVLPPATIEQRALEVRSEVNGGRRVKLSRALLGRQTTHRNTLGNHFDSQVFGYRPDARDTAQEILHAFVIGIALSI
jgi:hypothetical protein